MFSNNQHENSHGLRKGSAFHAGAASEYVAITPNPPPLVSVVLCGKWNPNKVIDRRCTHDVGDALYISQTRFESDHSATANPERVLQAFVDSSNGTKQ